MKQKDIMHFRGIGEYVERYGLATHPDAGFYIMRYQEIKELSNLHITSFRNSFFEISLDISMGCPCLVDNFKCEPGTNRISIISPFRLQSIYSDIPHTTKELNGYSLFFKSEFLEFNVENKRLINWLPFIGHNVAPTLQLSNDTIGEFINLFERIIFHQNHPTLESESIIRHYINVLLLLLKNYSINECIKPINRESQIFAEFKQLLENDFLEFKSVKQIAERLHLSSKHFSESIKQVSGKTAMQYLNEKKIEYARSLLRHTDMSIKSIATDLNFENEAYFYTFFKRISGETPTQFRKK
jgi:AraC family transcriptional regulator, transcriptional activator of pobA